MIDVEPASLAAGACVLSWVTGYGYGRLKRFIYRMTYKGSL